MTAGTSAVSRVSTWVRRIFVAEVVPKAADRVVGKAAVEAAEVAELAVAAVPVAAVNKTMVKADDDVAAAAVRDEAKAPIWNRSKTATSRLNQAKDCSNFIRTDTA